ncbi:MAG: hypothetical protein HY901_02380 [Deltaproteobacteria bacterium]|nr:hypothetical protein [Deltaproteobacteria bacterium]
MPQRFTPKQGQYLTFIANYIAVHGQAPAEAELQAHFRVSPPSVHQMVLRLEELGLIAREPGRARSIRLLVSEDTIRAPGKSVSAAPTTATTDCVELAVATGCRVIVRMFEQYEDAVLDDEDFAPLVAAAASGVAEQVVDLGASKMAVDGARERVIACAVDLYVKGCAQNDPDGASEAEDGARFRRFLVPRKDR